MQVDPNLSTGLRGLDKVIKGLIPGDNLVWQVDSVEDYVPFVEPFAKVAGKLGRPLIYFRFAQHPPLIPEGIPAQVVELDPGQGFEQFVSAIHGVIEKNGSGGYYVFDCLSILAEAWHSDQMLGNWFLLTCPYLFDVEAIAYFALRRNQHAAETIGTIVDTAQVLMEVHRRRDRLYVQPWKAQARHSPTLHMLHAWQGGEFKPITESTTISEICSPGVWTRLQTATHQVGLWNRAFAQAMELTETPDADPEQVQRCFQRLLRMVLSRDGRILALAEKYLALEDLVEIGRRMVGTGLIGGKSVGMLLARAILRRREEKWADLLEPHDSFYIGSDVFYSYLVRNGIWNLRENRADPQRGLLGAERVRQRMLIGTFPEPICKQFEDMLDYFGQSPIIVRSSSLLEDNYGNAFAGKYDSVFCANQGSRHHRLEDFYAAVRAIYSSTMSSKALTYRAQRGLLELDEQMALLVQRVSGKSYGEMFFPQVAGVGFSFNPYVWHESIDPEAGMARVVLGMGTRAVDRSDDDYTRLVALNEPLRRPDADFGQEKRCSQRKVDVLDLTANQLVSRPFRQVAADAEDLPMHLLAQKDLDMERRAAKAGTPGAFPYVVTFDRLFTDTQFIPHIREMLATLQDAYGCAVDVEFTANFFGGEERINVLQCRPLQITGGGAILDPPEDLREEEVLFEARGAVIGPGRIGPVGRMIFVSPESYSRLPMADRYAVARLIGKLCHLDGEKAAGGLVLVGPGRWGTTSPELGVPVRFSEIDTASAICEVVTMGNGLVPDVSLGSHFFTEMIETDMLYFALFPERDGHALRTEKLLSLPNRLTDLAADGAKLQDTVRVIEWDAADQQPVAILNGNPVRQRVVCYLRPADTVATPTL